MDAVDRERVVRRLGAGVVHARAVHGGFTPAERWSLQLADGTRAFAKIATNDYTRAALHRERAAYRHLTGAPFAPRFLGFDEEPRPMLLLGDLSHARWPPPWEPGELERVAETVRAIEATPLPLPPIDVDRLRGAWSRIQADPDVFLATGVATAEWLAGALPALIEAAHAAPTAPDATLHHDLRSDNLCFDGDRVIVVDWSFAGRGPAGLDLAFMAPSARQEGGPLPEAWVPPMFAAWVAGYFAGCAGRPPIPSAPRVRRHQLRALRLALPWAARVLGLPPPDGRGHQADLAATHAALRAGDIDEATWHARIEEDLVDAYLATADPRRASGKSGDEVDWRWSRELVLDLVPGPRAHLLDVGCANGHLMASWVRWAAERGLDLEVHGLEISDRLARVARADHPALADRIHTGNVATWAPPRRYDIVHVGLDYVPVRRCRAVIDRIRREYLTPRGRVVLRPARVGGPEPDPAEALRAIGLEPAGVHDVPHPRDGTLRRSAWLPAGGSPP